jgi:hypothetical protein
LQQRVPLVLVELALRELVVPPARRPEQAEQQVQVPLGVLQQELRE